MFSKADEKALNAIRGNVEQFVQVLKNSRKGVRWDNLCFNTEWWIEVKKSKAYADSNKELVSKYAHRFAPSLLE